MRICECLITGLLYDECDKVSGNCSECSHYLEIEDDENMDDDYSLEGVD